MLKHLSVSSSHSEWNQGAAPPPPFPLPTLISTLLHPLCPTMSHSLVTYLVPAYLESQHRVQFQELGNSWPVTRLECIRIRAFHTLFRYTRSCVALSHRVVRVERSVSDTALSRRFHDYLWYLWTNSCFYYVLLERDRGELRGGWEFELCWNYAFDLRIEVQRDFWFDLIKCGLINRSMGELGKE